MENTVSILAAKLDLQLSSVPASALRITGSSGIRRAEGNMLVPSHASLQQCMPNLATISGRFQAVEVKEGLEPGISDIPFARITYQLFFNFYKKLSGMTVSCVPVLLHIFSGQSSP